MQVVALTLDGELPAYGIDSTVLDLRSQIDAVGSCGRLARLVRTWRALRDRWRLERPDAVLAHSIRAALFTLTAARAAGVRRRLVVVHMNQRELGRERLVTLLALSATGVLSDIVYCGRAASAGFDALPSFVRRLRRVVPNGVRLPTGGQVERVEGPEAQFVVTARLTPGKNIAVLVRAIAAVGAPASLDIFGDGSERRALEALARSLSAPVTFRGQVHPESLAEEYRRATAFCFPSRSEGLPLVLIEASAAGLPVIASEAAFNREVMGEAALYRDADDVVGWAEAMTRMATDARLRARLAAEGQARAELFSIDQMVASYAALLADPTATP